MKRRGILHRDLCSLIASLGHTDVICIADALKAVNEGKMAATIAQQPKVMGQLSVETASTLLKGGKVAKFTPVPLKLVTKNP